MKILVIEDNKQLAETIKTIIGGYYVVELARDGEQALSLLEDEVYELVLLDLNLPDVPGLDICRTIRDQGKNMPILVITGEDRPATMVELLDAGADDYLTKPFRTMELKARVRALLRRQATRAITPGLLVAGDLKLDREKHCAIRAGQQVHLTSKEFIILEQLMLHPGAVMTRSLLFSTAWDSSDSAWTNTVDVHIKYLRDKIDKPFGAHSIETVHGIGYRLNPGVVVL